MIIMNYDEIDIDKIVNECCSARELPQSDNDHATVTLFLR